MGIPQRTGKNCMNVVCVCVCVCSSENINHPSFGQFGLDNLDYSIVREGYPYMYHYLS